MGEFWKIFPAVIAIFLIGFEVGKYATMNKVRQTIREATKQLEDMTKSLKKQAEEKSNESA